MTNKELQEELKNYPDDFEIQFSFSDIENTLGWHIKYTRFNNLKINDIGWQSKIIQLEGDKL